MPKNNAIIRVKPTSGNQSQRREDMARQGVDTPFAAV
jgi:hypothetical protein